MCNSNKTLLLYVLSPYVEIAVNDCRADIKKYTEDYSTFMQDDQISDVSALRIDNGKIAEELVLHMNWDDIRVDLVSRNKGISDLSVNYISTISETADKLERQSAITADV